MGRVIEFRFWSVTGKMLDWQELRTLHVATLFDKDVSDRLMQFTGLLDKNGVKIFEGDILIDPLIKPEHYESGNYSYGVVDFFNGIFRIGYGHIDKTLYDEIGAAYKQVVVGNIHQHSQLLEKK